MNYYWSNKSISALMVSEEAAGLHIVTYSCIVHCVPDYIDDCVSNGYFFLCFRLYVYHKFIVIIINLVELQGDK